MHHHLLSFKYLHLLWWQVRLVSNSVRFLKNLTEKGRCKQQYSSLLYPCYCNARKHQIQYTHLQADFTKIETGRISFHIPDVGASLKPLLLPTWWQKCWVVIPNTSRQMENFLNWAWRLCSCLACSSQRSRSCWIKALSRSRALSVGTACPRTTQQNIYFHPEQTWTFFLVKM